MRQDSHTKHQHNEHDDQLEVGIERSRKHLCCSDAKCLEQDYTVPKPQFVPAFANKLDGYS